MYSSSKALKARGKYLYKKYFNSGMSISLLNTNNPKSSKCLDILILSSLIIKLCLFEIGMGISSILLVYNSNSFKKCKLYLILYYIF
mgnify:CR=1 FL=1